MKEVENMSNPMPMEFTPEQLERDEAERAAHEEKTFAPYRKAREQREVSAEIVAEHDDMLAEMLFEITMNQFGEEV